MKKIIILIIFLVGVFIVTIFYRVESFEVSADKSMDISFEYEGNKLAGTLYLPKASPPYDVVVFIHGDGPVDRSANDGYNFLMNHLLAEGIACFSYDKAGIAESEGNWLSQSMLDRSLEVELGLKALEQKISINKKGIIAFSQGGWVASKLFENNVSLDFAVVIGGAIDWMDQHIYYERKYAENNNFSDKETKEFLSYVKKTDEYIIKNDYEGYSDYVSSYDYEKPMTEQRFKFVYINHKANAIKGIKAIDVPFLGIFGENDQNVDVQESFQAYDKTFKMMNKTNYDLYIFPNATHSLLESQYQDHEIKLFIDSLIRGKDIFVKDFFNTISQWIVELE